MKGCQTKTLPPTDPDLFESCCLAWNCWGCYAALRQNGPLDTLSRAGPVSSENVLQVRHGEEKEHQIKNVFSLLSLNPFCQAIVKHVSRSMIKLFVTQLPA